MCCRPGRSTGSSGARSWSTTPCTPPAASPRPGHPAWPPAARARSLPTTFSPTTSPPVIGSPASATRSMHRAGRWPPLRTAPSSTWGGDFTTVDGQARGHIAQFDLPGGTLNTTFKPSLNGGVRALATAVSTVYAGGPFTAVNGTARTRLAAFNSGGALQGWAPKVDDGQVWSMVVAPDASRVIVGGSFTTLNGGKAALGMGSISTTTAALMPWAANTVIKNSTSGAAITSLRTDGTQIYGSGYAFGAGNLRAPLPPTRPPATSHC